MSRVAVKNFIDHHSDKTVFVTGHACLDSLRHALTTANRNEKIKHLPSERNGNNKLVNNRVQLSKHLFIESRKIGISVEYKGGFLASKVQFGIEGSKPS